MSRSGTRETAPLTGHVLAIAESGGSQPSRPRWWWRVDPPILGAIRVPPAMSVVMGEVARVSWGLWPLSAAATVEVCFLPGGLGFIEAP